jgi:hypothetical protein
VRPNRNGFRIRFVQILDIDRNRCSIFLTHHLAYYTLTVVEMAHSSNVIINGSTFNSARGDIYINNKDSGMHDF